MFDNAVLFFTAFTFVESAKILVVTPTPSISHQLIFHSLIQELINRDHEIFFITTDPMFPPNKLPRNLKEIDVHNVSYSLWNDLCYAMKKSVKSDLSMTTVPRNFNLLHNIIHHQLMDESVAKLLKDETIKFDLLIFEECATPALIFSHIFQAPVVLMSSLGECRDSINLLGGLIHPIIHPKFYERKIYNLTIWEKITVLYRYITVTWMLENIDSATDTFLQNFFDSRTPEIKELKNKVEMLLLNVHPIWTHNQPVPTNIIHTWGIQNIAEKKLPKHLQDYLNLSKNGVIFVSFGTNIKTSTIQPEVLKMLLSVFSQLSHDILWKWDEDELPGKSKNIKIAKWFPQKDILRHPNVKLFITQGGLQSTEEAVNAGVPLLGIPVFGDQYYNTEKYVYFSIGIQLQHRTLTTENLENAIRNILENHDSYMTNILNLRTKIRDQRKPSMDNAICWLEYVIRHRGTHHLRSPGANIPWTAYYELELVLLVLSTLIVLLTCIWFVLYYVFRRGYSWVFVGYKMMLRIFL